MFCAVGAPPGNVFVLNAPTAMTALPLAGSVIVPEVVAMPKSPSVLSI
jgi:hypothetical protein